MRIIGFKSTVILLLIMSMTVVTNAQNYKLHAVYINSFIRYVQWPINEGNFTIGVVGDSPIIEHLEKLAEAKKAGSRDIFIMKFSSAESAMPTDILFIAKESTNKMDALKSKLGKASTLIITEKEGAGMNGSGINFVERNGKLAFELNKSALEEVGLKVSTELTRLAIVL